MRYINLRFIYLLTYLTKRVVRVRLWQLRLVGISWQHHLSFITIAHYNHIADLFQPAYLLSNLTQIMRYSMHHLFWIAAMAQPKICHVTPVY